MPVPPFSTRLPRALGGWLFSIAAWGLITAIFLLVRTYGTGDTPDWLTGPGPVALMILVAGVLFGSLDRGVNLLVDHTRFRAKPFWALLLLKAGSLTIALFVVILLGRLLAVATGQLAAADLPAAYIEHVADKRVLAGSVYLAAAALVMVFIHQAAAMIGPRILANLMLGRYHHPREEELIFMFLDMKASTTVAEKLGHQEFSRMLQDCFRDLTDVAIKHRVEIYKYVGDEAILTWRPRDGLKNSNALRTFFAFCDALDDRRSHYESNYGMLPEFKAGLHLGPVTVAEVGVLKREIAYLSDVLNTAARIQGMCNEIGKSALLSGALRDRLPDDRAFVFDAEGEIALRGREERVALFAVRQRETESG